MLTVEYRKSELVLQLVGVRTKYQRLPPVNCQRCIVVYRLLRSVPRDGEALPCLYDL